MIYSEITGVVGVYTIIFFDDHNTVDQRSSTFDRRFAINDQNGRIDRDLLHELTRSCADRRFQDRSTQPLTSILLALSRYNCYYVSVNRQRQTSFPELVRSIYPFRQLTHRPIRSIFLSIVSLKTFSFLFVLIHVYNSRK